jgi:CRP-like cAMP-binding protein
MITVMSYRFVDLLGTLEGSARSLVRGAHLFHLGEPVTTVYIVLDGRIELRRHQEDGHVLVLQRAGGGEFVAEASLFSDRYHCDAVATTGTRVRAFPRPRILSRLRGDPDFAEALASHLAHEIQSLRFRSEILSLRKVASRLDAWEAWHGTLPPKGDWKQLAQQIGVSPEALYREMAKRRARRRGPVLRQQRNP